MKTTDYVKRLLWILLLLTPGWRLCGSSRIVIKSDSIAVAVELIHSAKSIKLDLIKGDWAIKRELICVTQLSKQEIAIKQLTGDLAISKTETGKLTTNEQLGEQALKTR